MTSPIERPRSALRSLDVGPAGERQGDEARLLAPLGMLHSIRAGGLAIDPCIVIGYALAGWLRGTLEGAAPPA